MDGPSCSRAKGIPKIVFLGLLTESTVQDRTGQDMIFHCLRGLEQEMAGFGFSEGYGMGQDGISC